MNQIALYKVLKNAGCKILSFEDYPDNLGSWRVSFLYNDVSCEVISNRYDAYMLLQSTSSKYGSHKNVIESKANDFTESFELVTLGSWLSYTANLSPLPYRQ